MNLLRLSLRMLLRDWRAGELRILVLALIIAVSGVTTVGFFADRVQRALVNESSQLLGGDLLVSSSQVLPPGYEQQAKRFRLKTAALTRFPSMVSYADNNLLCAIKAVTPGYPLRGKLQLTSLAEGDELSQSPARVAQGIPAPGTVWIDEKAMAALDVKLGDKLEIGMIELTVTELVASEPDHSVGFINMNPRLLINEKDLAASELIQPGSRVSYQLLVAGEIADVAAYRSWLEAQLVPGQSVEGIQDARPEIRAALDRAGKFLGLAALASVVVAAVAVALATRRFIQRHLDGCAVMRCLGATQSVLLRLYLYHFLMLGAFSSLLGCMLGVIAQEFLSRWLAELAGTVLPPPGGLPAVQGMLTGMVLLLGFSLPPLLNLRQVPALRVIRRDMGMTSLHGFAGYAFGLLMLSTLFIWKAGDLKLGLLIMLGFLLAVAAFAAIGWVIIRLMLLMRAQGSGAWHYGLANVKRRTLASLVQAVALGLGMMALMTLTLIRTDLLQDWQTRLPPDTPNRFLINIQPDQQPALFTFFEQHEIAQPEMFPMVRGRLTRINDGTVRPEDYDHNPHAKQFIMREFNLSWMDKLQQDNEIVAGEWWRSTEADFNELSMEEDFAKTIGVKLGDRMTFHIAGEDFTATITSLRKIDWDTFHVNFFAVLRPGSLDNYPATYVTSFYLPPSQVGVMQHLVRAFPNILIIDVASMIERVQTMIAQVARAVEFVFMFTLLAGFIVLYAAIAATQDERRYEAAIFRTLGARKRQLARAWLVEFAILGGLAGIFAAAGSGVLGYVISERTLHLSYTPNPWLWLIGILIGVISVTAAGLIGTRSTLSQPPLLTLRKAG
ncbi:ABC transporter permease [Nitrosomonas mobilis]|uniref:ABC3 transporter permease protein domain-containing protein n=1 Tax=Nitrosomonas mobilis TaxID=51642 RepID=A0A1G5SHR5_9PROT|nr:FtsX-like permease family protein [Nitrosomonas mobilis]SCZ86668.1 conserved membrane hypothetical protein [Nitrosomonas mobilis]